MLSCFRQRSAAESTTGVGSSGGGDATSIYSTRLGDVGLTWSRSLLGLSLLVDLTWFSASLKIRPWTYMKRKGSKKTYLLTGADKVAVEITWDLTRATFSSSAADPVAGFFVSVSVDGDLVLSAGDLKKEHLSNPISRRERARFVKKRGKVTYSTAARFEGRQRKISIQLEERENELGMEVKLEGKKVLEVTRLGWKFRGSERVAIEGGGDRIQISWDFCRWFSSVKGDADAVFVFRFERGDEVEGWEEEEEGHIGKNSLGAFSGRSWGWSESSFGSTVTSSSAGASSSVMEWESLEEAEMRRSEGFSLVVLGFKK